MAVLGRSLLDSYVGQNISSICDRGFTNDQDLHCAHFVGHVLGVRLGGSRCGGGKGVTLGVGAIAQNSPNFRVFTAGDAAAEAGCLIYVAKASQVKVATRTIKPKRHIGFYFQGTVWHYENDKGYERVIAHEIGKTSFPRFKGRYGSGCGLWVSDFPPGATAVALQST